MRKFLILLLMLFTCILAGSLYGILHDQFTYTLCPEYYTRFKFVQFGLISHPSEKIHAPRMAVTLTGIIATWWMGFLISLILGITALFHKDRKAMFRITIKAMTITMAIAFATGLAGLLYGWLTRNHIDGGLFYLYDIVDIQDKQGFHMVSCMHNSSYLGGGLGLLSGIAYIIRKKRKDTL